MLYSRTNQGPRVRAAPRQLRAAPERRRRGDGEATEPGCGGDARGAGAGGQGRPSSESTCIAFTLSSLQHLLSKKPNKHSALDGVHKYAGYRWSFYKTNSFPHVSTCRHFSSLSTMACQKRMASNRSLPGLCLGLRAGHLTSITEPATRPLIAGVTDTQGVLLTPLKPECPSTICSTNCFLTFCSC